MNAPLNWGCLRAEEREHERARAFRVLTSNNVLKVPRQVGLIFSKARDGRTEETVYKVAICHRGNLLHMQIYLITDLNLLWKRVFGIEFIYFISNFTL